MLYTHDHTLAQFLDGAAAKQPAPGGGSVAALVGALAAAMGEMVLAYSVAKKGLEAHQEALRSALAELHRARQMLLQLMIEDQNAYQALSAARKLPENSPEWQSQFPAALLASIRVPESIAAGAAAVLAVCQRLVPIVNPYLLSDLAVSAELAMATVRCAIYNVRVNLADVTDRSDREKIERVIQQVQSGAGAVIRRVIPAIWQRVEAGE